MAVADACMVGDSGGISAIWQRYQPGQNGLADAIIPDRGSGHARGGVRDK